MPFHKTIYKCGAKTICIRTQPQEKCKISIILSIAGYGTKLIPYTIFKGAANGKIIKDLIKTKYVTEKRCICQTNKNDGVVIQLLLIGLIMYIYLILLLKNLI